MNGVTTSNSILTDSIQLVSPAEPSWQQCLNTIAHDFYHLPGYLQLEAQRYQATPEAIIIRDGGQVFFLPYLIRDCDRFNDSKLGRSQIYDVVSPYGYPGMLVNPSGQNPGFVKECLNLTHDLWRSKNICSAFIRLHPILNSYIDSSLSTRDKFVACSQGDVVVVDLSQDIAKIWQQTRGNHRTKINKLRRAGFTAQMVSIDKYLDTFIDIYQETMDRVNATSSYYFTRDYFHGLIDALGTGIHLCIVTTEERVVSAALITEFSGIVQYHLGGTSTEFLDRSPATLMLYAAIEWAKQSGNKYMNLGGGLGGSQDSLYHFKAGFSDLSKPFVTLKTIVDNEVYARLTCLRAESLGMTLSAIEDNSFFPVYRLN